MCSKPQGRIVDHVHIGKVSVRNHEPQRHQGFFLSVFCFLRQLVGGGGAIRLRKPANRITVCAGAQATVQMFFFFFSFWDSSHEAESEGFDDTCILGYMITTCTLHRE